MDRALLYAACAQFESFDDYAGAAPDRAAKPEITAILMADQPLERITTSKDGLTVVASGRRHYLCLGHIIETTSPYHPGYRAIRYIARCQPGWRHSSRSRAAGSEATKERTLVEPCRFVDLD